MWLNEIIYLNIKQIMYNSELLHNITFQSFRRNYHYQAPKWLCMYEFVLYS